MEQWKLERIHLNMLYFRLEKKNWNRDREPGFSHGTETGNRNRVLVSSSYDTQGDVEDQGF
jgi:hypothetical protein